MPSTQKRRVIAVLDADEADALVNLGAALDGFIVRDSPADRATAKLDEQMAAQYRDPYKEAEDMNEPDYDAAVDRILGIYQ